VFRALIALNMDRRATVQNDAKSGEDRVDFSLSRREALKALGAGAAAVAAGGHLAASAKASETGAKPGAKPLATPPSGGPYNFLFILTDQERMFRPGELPADYHLPAHERLIERGTLFENHCIGSAVCTPSRSVLYTGQHIQHTRMFDNTNFPWINSMSTDIPTIGHLLRDVGYHTAYKGKWHLTKEFETVNKLGSPTKIFTQEMEAYGFSDYFGVGDIIGHDRGGYLHDGVISAMAVNWLRGRGMELSAERKPWFLAVNLVNPHDVMFLNTDRPGEAVQNRNILGHIRPEPTDPLYQKQWTFDLPKTYSERLDAPGRPRCHADYLRSHDALMGRVANEDWRWKRRHNYYLNCLRDVDRSIETVLAEIDSLGFASNTIIVMTADHGDLDGAHRLHSKGATAYREQNNVPLIVAHPALPGGKRCKAVTSHLDIAPTLVGLSGASAERKKEVTKKLPGKDFSAVFAAPEKATRDSVRDGALFCYNMFAYIDGEFLERAVEIKQQPDGKAKIAEAVKTGQLRPDMKKRGAIRSVYDGKYRFTRYFSPREHHRPTTIEVVYAHNDLELFDLEADPLEQTNLALDRSKYQHVIEEMNAKLNALIDREVGEDLGQMLPKDPGGGWVLTGAVNDV
jgi:arylsulfatase